MRRTLVFLLLTVAAVYLVVLAGSLEPPGPPAPTMKTLDQVEPRIAIGQSDFGTDGLEISEPGSYYFVGDITVPGDGILITADNATIDLAGFAIAGEGVGQGITVSTLGTVTIQNGTVRDFAMGVVVNGTGRITALHVLNCGTYGIWATFYSGQIDHCIVSSNEVGIKVENSSGIVTSIFDSTIGNNSGMGIDGGGMHVERCAIATNFGGGVRLQEGSVLADSAIQWNAAFGVECDSGTVRDNSLIPRNDPIGINASSQCIVIGNALRGFSSPVVGSGPGIAPVGPASTATSPFANVTD